MERGNDRGYLKVDISPDQFTLPIKVDHSQEDSTTNNVTTTLEKYELLFDKQA